MEDFRSENATKAVTEVRRPWHKPELLRLTVTLDTANGPGSGPDFATKGLFTHD